jgi:hypothetical protein
MHVVPCPRHPLSSAFSSLFCFVLLHGVWWAWDGSLLFFFSVATTTITHLQSVWGYYYLLPPIPHPIIYLDCTLFSLSHLLGAVGCMAPWVGIIGGIGVWAEGFASTDSQSYIYLIGISWSLASFLLFSRILCINLVGCNQRLHLRLGMD